MQPFVRLGLTLGAALLLSSSSSFAVSIFSDDFDSATHPVGLAANDPHWTYLVGNIDIVNFDSYSIPCGTANNCADLDGTYYNEAVIMRSTPVLHFVQGLEYQLSFWISGNPIDVGKIDTAVFSIVDTAGEVIGVSDASISGDDAVLGTGASGSISLLSGSAGRVITLTFTPDANYSGHIQFDATQGDNVGDQRGLILDDVNLDAAVPEPSSLALIGAGLVLVGMRVRRKA